MFRAHVLNVRGAKLHYTVSGIITPTGVMIPVSIHVSSTCAHRQEGKTVLYSLWWSHVLETCRGLK